jgi:hypothetical protein
MNDKWWRTLLGVCSLLLASCFFLVHFSFGLGDELEREKMSASPALVCDACFHVEVGVGWKF